MSEKAIVRIDFNSLKPSEKYKIVVGLFRKIDGWGHSVEYTNAEENDLTIWGNYASEYLDGVENKSSCEYLVYNFPVNQQKGDMSDEAADLLYWSVYCTNQIEHGVAFLIFQRLVKEYRARFKKIYHT